MAIIKVITPSVTDANITAAKVTDNAITLAKMASGTDGNIISYDASGNPVAIATGNDGQVLTSTGAGSPPAFENASSGANTPVFSAYMSAGQNIPNTTFTKIAFNTENFDVGGCYDTSNKRFVVPSGQAGKYVIVAKSAIDGIDDGEHVDIALYKNGSRDNKTYISDYSSKTNGIVYVETQKIYALDVGDYIEAFIYHNEGDERAAENTQSYFYGFKIIE